MGADDGEYAGGVIDSWAGGPTGDAADETAARARMFARALTAAAGVPVTVRWQGNSGVGTAYGKWDICWSGGSPSVSAMSSYVAALAHRFPDIEPHVRYAWRAPSRRQ